MSEPKPQPPATGRRALAPDNIWSQRRQRRLAMAERKEQANAAAEFSRAQPRRHNLLAVLLGAAGLMILLGAIAGYLLKKPAVVTAAAGAPASTGQWRGSLPEETATAFLSAASHAERMRWVRSPQLVEPLVAAFFSTGPGSRETFSQRASLPLPQLGAALPAEEIARYAVLMADNSKRLLSIVATPEGARIDFHTYIRHSSAPWPEILTGRAARAEVRIFVSPGNYHAAPFESSAEWLPVLGICPDVPADLLLYARRGTPECAALEAAFLKAPQQRVTLTLAPVQDSWQRRQYQVEAFHHEEWYGPPETPAVQK